MKKQAAPAARKARSLGADAWYRFKKNRLAVISLIFLCLMIVLAFSTFVVDWVTDSSFYDAKVIAQDLRRRLEPPSWEHPLGLDEFGRDMLLRILWGARYSLFMGMAAVCGATLLGGFLGAISGFYKTADGIIMRIMDVLLAVPTILLATAIVAAFGTSKVNLIMAILVSQTPTFARVVRASVLTVKEQEYIEAARAMGASDMHIIIKYIIPNSLSPLIVQCTMSVASAILSIASLSFIGLGIQPPMPEWGAMLSNARTYIRDSWHITVIPGAAIMLTILMLNIIGDGLRDALDPRLKN